MDSTTVSVRKKTTSHVLGWIVTGLSTTVTTLWAVWGTIEAFHEGWWMPTPGGRLLQTLAYLTPMLIMLAVSLLAIRWPRFGAVVYFLVGALFSVFIFGQRWGNMTLSGVLSWLPVTVMLLGIGLCYWFAAFRNRRLMYMIVALVPLLVCLACAVEPAWRVTHRIDDGDRGEQIVYGNGVALVWAPAGPGWTLDAEHAVDWHAATKICRHLSADGLALCDDPQDIWRLPSVDEAVRSMARHGNNCGGVWNAETKTASYRVRPDKESPLWVPFAETIYWWTSTEIDADRAWIIVYDGKAWPKDKHRRMGSRGFRAVRDP